MAEAEAVNVTFAEVCVTLFVPAAVAGTQEEFTTEMLSNAPGGCAPSDPSLRQVKTKRTVVPARAAGSVIVPRL